MSSSTLAPFTCFIRPISSMRRIQSRRSSYARLPPRSVRGRVSIAMRATPFAFGASVASHAGRDLGAGPALEQTLLNAELVQGALHRVVDDVVDGLGLVVEGGHRRQDDATVLRYLEHQAQMAAVERRFADDHDELAALLQRDVS